MIPYIAIAAGVAVGASIIRCIFDELSAEEVSHRDKLIKRQAQAKEEYEQYKSKLETVMRTDLYSLSKEEAQKAADLRRKHSADMANAVAAYYQELLDAAKQHCSSKENLCHEIIQTITAVKRAMNGQVTMLRRNSLLCLLRELEEAKEKTDTYCKYYLGRYIRYLEDRKRFHNNELPEVFSFTLPENYFYTGKLIYMKKEELMPNGSVQIHKYESLNYRFEEYDFISDLPVDSEIPLMCDKFLTAPDYTRILSARKGYFKSIVTSNPKIGISATVIGYNERKQVLLDYNDCVELILPRGNLANEKRYPPIGAVVRVYPTNWTYSLYRPVEVSERTSDSYLSYSFDDLPIVFSRSQWEELKELLDERSLLGSTGDWKIAPLNENNIANIDEVKLQLDNDICLSAKIVNSCGKLYFSYNGILDNTYFVRPDDVFLGIDCVLNIYLDSDLDLIEEETQENMANLVLMCLSEFKVQFQIKISHHGMQYFNKWAETTDKLITYLQKGSHTEVEIKNIEKNPQRYGNAADYRISVRNPETLKEYVDNVYQEAKTVRNVEFFFELSPGVQCFVSIKGDASVLYASEDAGLMDAFLADREILTLYQKQFPYAEFQQAHALHQFRIGKLVNPLLQSYALDGANIQPNGIPQSITLFNQRILGDSSQLSAIECALGEKDIFLIQGPPGTGKTTVIREIILQTLKANPFTKILVVSQANVAVDNVLRGLVNRSAFSVDFVRCGHLDKIDTRIENHSFEHIYADYVEFIQRKANAEPNNILYNKWYNFVVSGGQYNPNVGELILKSKPVIGATCVGLAQKRIGLNRVTYDLVIIDEAGKALPAEILIPYIRGKKVILIGDHRQLPPTVHPALLDPEKVDLDDRDLFEDELFSTSFFQRMFIAAPDSNKRMLTTQYRMPVEIGNMVSALFYNHALRNGEGTDSKKSLYFKNNLTLINTVHPRFNEVSESGKSITNPEEAKLVIALLFRIREAVPDARVAVITPYKGQKRAILKLIAAQDQQKSLHGIDVNTVDAFQGDEAEIVIFCCTRTNRQTSFFKDPRRLNVAFSRAMNELIIVGSMKYFLSYDQSSVLPDVAKYILQNGSVVNADVFLGQGSTSSISYIPLSSVYINSDLRATPPKEWKINAVLDYFRTHGELDKPIVVTPRGTGYALVDKYLRYYVAEILRFREIPAIILPC